MSVNLSPRFHPDPHPIARGRNVAVLRLGMMAAPHIEGIAVVHDVGRQPDEYWVTFRGDPIPRLRTVFLVCQSDVLVEALQRLWRVEAGRPVVLPASREVALFAAFVVMPETAVHEDQLAATGEDNVRTPRNIGAVEPETVA